MTNNAATKSSYRECVSFDDRVLESKTIMARNPDHVPIIVDRIKFCHSLEDLPKSKFLVTRDSTVARLQATIRRMLDLDEIQTLILFDSSNRVIVPTMKVGELYYSLKQEIERKGATTSGEEEQFDGFIYLQYSAENCFG